MIREHLDKDNLHHAYLIEGSKDEVLSEIYEFLKEIDVDTKNNGDLIQMNLDSFKMDDARDLKSYTSEKSLTNSKKVFIIYANNFLIEAQNSLLKLFEEPIENTFFFIITPDTSIMIKTLLSRFYFISTKQNFDEEDKNAKKFIKMNTPTRLLFIKELLTEEDGEDEISNINSTRSKALRFLNALEGTLHGKVSEGVLDTKIFEHLFKVRKFLRQPGSSTKSLMESVALITPNFSN